MRSSTSPRPLRLVDRSRYHHEQRAAVAVGCPTGSAATSRHFWSPLGRFIARFGLNTGTHRSSGSIKVHALSTTMRALRRRHEPGRPHRGPWLTHHSSHYLGRSLWTRTIGEDGGWRAWLKLPRARPIPRRPLRCVCDDGAESAQSGSLATLRWAPHWPLPNRSMAPDGSCTAESGRA